MKKIVYLLIALVLISSCSTYYGKYDYDQYFQTNEPFVTVDSEEEAAQHIARKLARSFRRAPYQTIAILNFTDEYGDRLNRGVFFADMITSGLLYYRNPGVVERDELYEIVKERELSQTSLLQNRGSELYELAQADYIMSGRILRGRYEDMISVRCFRVGTGEVVYASTISIDYTPDPVIVSTPPTYPPTGGGVIIVNPPDPGQAVIIIDDDDDNDNNGSTDVKKPHNTYPKKPATGTESKGTVDLDNIKKPRTGDDQYQYKKAPSNSNTSIKKHNYGVNNKNVAPKKDIKVVKRPKPVYKYKSEETKEDEKESKNSSTSSSSKKSSSSSSSKKSVTGGSKIKKVTTIKK